MNVLFFHRSLQREIMDLDCKGLCQARFTHTYFFTRLPQLYASSGQVCNGTSGMEFCGKEVT